MDLNTGQVKADQIADRSDQEIAKIDQTGRFKLSQSVIFSKKPTRGNMPPSLPILSSIK